MNQIWNEKMKIMQCFIINTPMEHGMMEILGDIQQIVEKHLFVNGMKRWIRMNILRREIYEQF